MTLQFSIRYILFCVMPIVALVAVAFAQSTVIGKMAFGVLAVAYELLYRRWTKRW